MRTTRQQLGERGERIAGQWLEARGWTILERRFRSGHRDIDLVIGRVEAQGRVVAFVEVKTRASADFGGALSAVGWQKQREMARAARAWLSSGRRTGDVYRFDVVGVLYDSRGFEVTHIENAFQ
ncbi:MAG: YraN family protein, partial [Thermoanaerobaculia bacterium]